MLPAFSDERVIMFDSQNPMNALGLMYALRLTQDLPQRRNARVSVSWFTHVLRAMRSGVGSRTKLASKMVPATRILPPIKPDLPSRRAA